ncbi:MAG: hypothetical protein Q8862_10585 [Bacteroidota bacterium]|nr:hypothetical protein [Bacteroidota bacterium]MDP4204999.1 hypothetical protein [Bacteroidota bacterium]
MIKNFTLKIDYFTLHIDPEFKPQDKTTQSDLKYLALPTIQEQTPSEWVCTKIIGYARALRTLKSQCTGVIETIMN